MIAFVVDCMRNFTTAYQQVASMGEGLSLEAKLLSRYFYSCLDFFASISVLHNSLRDS